VIKPSGHNTGVSGVCIYSASVLYIVMYDENKMMSDAVLFCLQCFDTVGLATGRASGL